MPELPEVETVCRGLAPVLEGRLLAKVECRRADLRRPIPEAFADRLVGRRVERVDRRAKYMLWRCEGGVTILLHLGMSGRMRVTSARPAPLARHDHLVFTTDAGMVICFNDARRFGVVDLIEGGALEDHPALVSLGPEPLGNGFNGPVLAAAFAVRRMPVKSALLDQKLVAGLGNIYVCEALHRAGISPRRLTVNVGASRASRLVDAVRTVLGEAIRAGGSSLRDHVQPTGELGYFQHRFRVYGREGEACQRAGCCGMIQRVVQAGRSTFYCAACQR